WKLEGFAEAVLAPFGPNQIHRFVKSWYAYVGPLRHLSPEDSQGRAVQLNGAIERSERLAELASRPLQLSLVEWLRVDRKQVRDLLDQLAFEAHRDQKDLRGTADIAESVLVNGLMSLNLNPDVRPSRLMEYVSTRAGLLE